MKYRKTVQAIFIDRPNRFIAHVLLEGKVETVHVKNTGRCKELLIKDVPVILEESDNPNRKTKYDLITVYKDNLGWVNIDSQATNKVVGEWLREETGELSLFHDITYLKPEYVYGDSRIDFYFEQKNGEKKVMIEVKGVTLERDGEAFFPDAPTLRGVKHIQELEKAVKAGYECYIAFVIQMKGMDVVYPNDVTHPEFGQALKKAHENGVGILYLGCSVTEDTLQIDRVFKEKEKK